MLKYTKNYKNTIHNHSKTINNNNLNICMDSKLWNFNIVDSSFIMSLVLIVAIGFYQIYVLL